MTGVSLIFVQLSHHFIISDYDRPRTSRGVFSFLMTRRASQCQVRRRGGKEARLQQRKSVKLLKSAEIYAIILYM